MAAKVFWAITVALIIWLKLVACEDNDGECGMQWKSKLVISAFNIQVFGKSKVKKAKVTDVLLEILDRYDLIGVLEIRDSSQTAFPRLMRQLNQYTGGEDYGYFTGRRKGRTTSKEQTGFVYRKDKLQLLTVYESNDTNDEFEREPTVARFRRIDSKGAVREFTFIPVHIKPDDVLAEMNSLVKVCEEAERLLGENIILAGDMNADCSYMRKAEWKDCKLRQDPRFLWMIPDDYDTTTKKTDCAYDRIVLKGSHIMRNSCCAKPFNYGRKYHLDKDIVEKVSDHYPVQFYLF